ncbi:arylesterase [Falsihalocynthiibacter sp. SS001]|uniref:arylesterase n=1 Tax=Falsihalocynthiibacter sp. SS001 TaxID=3349698 RepID=UPI0036D39048
MNIFPRHWGGILYGVEGLRYKLATLAIIVACGLASTAKSETVVIAALGDSITNGYGLAPEDGLIGQLQTWMDEQGHDVRLINAGVSGDTTAGGRARIEWTLTPEVDAVIVELGGNDMMRGIAPSDSRKNLDETLAIIQSRDLPTLLVGLPAASNFGADYKAEFDGMYPSLAEQYQALLYPDLFASVRDTITDPTALKTYMQDDAIHPNAKGVAEIVKDIAPLVVELADRARVD